MGIGLAAVALSLSIWRSVAVGAHHKSNPQHRLASNVVVTAHYRMLGIVVLLATAANVTATPIEPTAKELIQELQRPAVKFVPARVGWNTQERTTVPFNPTFEQYGPQATVRAVRASLKAALTPDPVAMGALFFCAFALRWMRMRSDRTQEAESSPAGSEVGLPRAA
jgi:hypothetical protein